MLIRIVRMTFKEEEVENFLAMFESKKQLIRHFPGCTHLELQKDYNNPCVFATYSIWNDESDLNNYRNSELFVEVWAETKAKFAAKPIAFSLREFIKVD